MHAPDAPRSGYKIRRFGKVYIRHAQARIMWKVGGWGRDENRDAGAGRRIGGTSAEPVLFFFFNNLS